ncbi:MAG: hypothetical protein ACLT40_05270 [Fusobacterium sp.]
MRENIIKYGNQEDINKILELSDELELYTFVMEGVLVDNYYIENFDKIKIEKATRKYIYIKENYLNEWSSNYKIILTDKIYDFETEEEFEEVLKKL